MKEDRRPGHHRSGPDSATTDNQLVQHRRDEIASLRVPLVPDDRECGIEKCAGAPEEKHSRCRNVADRILLRSLEDSPIVRRAHERESRIDGPEHPSHRVGLVVRDCVGQRRRQAAVDRVCSDDQERLAALEMVDRQENRAEGALGRGRRRDDGGATKRELDHLAH